MRRFSQVILLLSSLISGLGSASKASGHPVSSVTVAEPEELVVLVHGMGRTPVSMIPLELSLEQAGYRVMNFGYSSYGPGIAEIGAELSKALEAELAENPATRVHFVGHSLGNVVIRWMLAFESPDAELGRFLMLAPPNQGSASADRMERFVGWLLAPISELKTSGSTVRSMPSLTGIEFAIIAGSSDGKVSVEETCLAGARLHLLVPAAHTFIMLPPSIHDMIELFLRTGSVGGEVDRVPEGTCSS